MSTNAPTTNPGVSAPLATPKVPYNTSMLSDDPAVLKQMIAELIRELQTARRDRESVQQRLDALLRRLHGPRPAADNPQQPSLFPDLPGSDAEVSAEPIPPASPPTEEPANRRGKNQSHGRRQPPSHLRREARRYELTEGERCCPDCGMSRGEIGVETSEQYDYKPAEVFVIEHQRVKYVCACCQGQVCQAPKPRHPSTRDCPVPDSWLRSLPISTSIIFPFIGLRSGWGRHCRVRRCATGWRPVPTC
jgi:transposase